MERSRESEAAARSSESLIFWLCDLNWSFWFGQSEVTENKAAEKMKWLLIGKW